MSMSEELREKAKPAAYQQLKDGKWVECSHFVAFGWGDVIDKECRRLYSEADYLALLSANEAMLSALKRLTDYSRKPTQADWQAADAAIAKAEGSQS